MEIYGTTLEIRTNDTFSKVDLGNFASGVIREWFFADLCDKIQRVLGVKIRSFNLLASDIRNPSCLNRAFSVHDSVPGAAAKKKLEEMRKQCALAMATGIKRL